MREQPAAEQATCPVTPAQRAALLLVRTGGYVYDPASGGARHSRLTHATKIARRTLLVLVESGLVAYDEFYGDVLVLTAAGRAAVTPLADGGTDE